MSTTVYCAYRVPIKKANEYLGWARAQLLKAAAHRVDVLASKIPSSDIMPPPMDWEGDIYRRERLKRYEIVLKHTCVKVAESPFRDPTRDIECGLIMWLSTRWAYFAPWGESSLTDIINRDPPACAEEYSYWNNAEGPEDVSAREWSTRARVWKRLLTVTNELRLHHDVVKMTPTGVFALEVELGVWDEW